MVCASIPSPWPHAPSAAATSSRYSLNFSSLSPGRTTYLAANIPWHSAFIDDRALPRP